MKMAGKIYVTGAGIITALGTGVEDTLAALRESRSGVGALRRLVTDLSYLPAGEVDASTADLAAEVSATYPSSALRSVVLGIVAAHEAASTAALDLDDLRRAAFISGTTVGGMDHTEQHFGAVSESGGQTPEAAELRYNDCGYSTELIADALGSFGFVTTPSTACSSAANAVILGANLIKTGMADIAVVGGTEALTRFHFNGFNTLMILDPERCRPFDRDRAGINLGEGAAYLVIESEESAHRRGVRPMAELSGYANACDAFHQTASSDNGEGAFRSMRAALDMAGLQPSDIGYVNAHGTGTPNNDITELAAMRRIWGDTLPPFSSTKPFTGHTTSASGAVESVICLLALRHGLLPPCLGFVNPIEPGAEPVTRLTEVDGLRHVLNNSFGFGGNDSSLIFSTTEE